jgi:hypothetical protein
MCSYTLLLCYIDVFAVLGGRFLNVDPFCYIEPLACLWPPMPAVDPAKLRSLCDVLGFCLVPAKPPANRIFGFAEFVQALALLVLVYTLSDLRYRFRAATAAIPIWGVTFLLTGLVGFGTLLLDFWFSNELPIFIFLSNQTYWQLAFGAAFITTVLLWLWYTYLSPPVFGPRNASRFTAQLHYFVLQGDESDLPVIASELRRSAPNIIEYASILPERYPPGFKRPKEPEISETSKCANAILLIMGSRKFCRHIIASAPLTAIAFFASMSDRKKYRLSIGQFAANVSTEALQQKDSILYHEDEGFYSGYFGYTRPFTNALYGDFRLVEALTEGNSPLDIDYRIRDRFDARQFKAYCRAVLTTFSSALEHGGFYDHSYALYRAFSVIESSATDLYRLNEEPRPADADEITGRLDAAIGFINDAIDLIEKKGIFRTRLRRHDEPYKWRDDYYDHLAHIALELIWSASRVTTKDFSTWSVQHNAVWSRLFSFHDSKTRRIVLFKLRRLLYEEIKDLGSSPDFKNGAYLAYLLNVLSPAPVVRRDFRRNEEFPIRRAVVGWTRRNYLWLVRRSPQVAKAVLIADITFDSKRKRIIKTYFRGLNSRAAQDILTLDDTRANAEFGDSSRKKE